MYFSILENDSVLSNRKSQASKHSSKWHLDIWKYKLAVQGFQVDQCDASIKQWPGDVITNGVKRYMLIYNCSTRFSLP